MNQNLISFDPSSSCMGWAALRFGDKKCELLDAGKISYRRKSITCPNDAIEAILADVKEIVEKFEATVAVVELAQNRHIKYRKPASTDVYKNAVFACRLQCWDAVGRENTYTFTVGDWKGSKSKEITLLEVNDRYGLALELKDNDISDAIGIGDYWLQVLGTKSEIKPDTEKKA